MSEAMTDAMETIYGLQEEVRSLREENEQMKEGLDAIIDAPPSDELTKLRKVAEAAKPCVEKDEEGAWRLIVEDWDPAVMERLNTLEDALRDLGEVGDK